MSDNPLTRVLLTAIMQPDQLGSMARSAAKETFGLVLEATGQAARKSAAEEITEEGEEKEKRRCR